MRWVDVIYNLVNAYNNFRHRFIGMSPTNIHKKVEDRF